MFHGKSRCTIAMTITTLLIFLTQLHQMVYLLMGSSSRKIIMLYSLICNLDPRNGLYNGMNFVVMGLWTMQLMLKLSMTQRWESGFIPRVPQSL